MKSKADAFGRRERLTKRRRKVASIIMVIGNMEAQESGVFVVVVRVDFRCGRRERDLVKFERMQC